MAHKLSIENISILLKTIRIIPYFKEAFYTKANDMRFSIFQFLRFIEDEELLKQGAFTIIYLPSIKPCM